MPEVDPLVINVVTVGKDDPYPTGTPPDGTLIPARVHLPPQQLIAAAKKYNQSQANLLAGGMIAGGAMYTGL
jgi:hypothetical protein